LKTQIKKIIKKCDERIKELDEEITNLQGSNLSNLDNLRIPVKIDKLIQLAKNLGVLEGISILKIELEGLLEINEKCEKRLMKKTKCISCGKIDHIDKLKRGVTFYCRNCGCRLYQIKE
jgi:predicted RNA-binding Zn-ribbon protein involved in translation (DUF1610 family)